MSLSPVQFALLANAVRAAPSLLNARTCRLRVVANRAELYGVPPAPAEASRRLSTISCGAALRNLELAVRRLGFVPQILELPDRANPSHVATVLVGAGAGCTVAEDRLYRAAFGGLAHRGPMASRPVPPALAMQLHAAGQAPGVATLLVGGAQVRVIAGVLAAGEPRPAGEPLPAGELGRGRSLLVTTVDDGPADWLRAGQALQNAWLTGATFGLVGRVIGAPVQAPGVRSGLIESLGLAGCPQVVLRLGWPGGSGGIDPDSQQATPSWDG